MIPRAAIFACLAFVVLAAVSGPPAVARSRDADRLVLRYPSDELPTVVALAGALQNAGSPRTVIFEKGTHTFAGGFFVFGNTDLQICGATGRPGDVTVVNEGGGPVFRLEQVEGIEISGLTIRTVTPGGEGVRLSASLNENFASFAGDVTLRSCNIDADFPIFATSGAEQLIVDRCTINVRRDDAWGITWSDGAGLQVTRTLFTSEGATEPLAAVFVLGAEANQASGERVPDVILTRNRIRGRFLRGFDLADVIDTRVQRNDIRLAGGSIRPAVGSRGPTGRQGIVVRRLAATSLPDGIGLYRNRVRNAHWGIWLVSLGSGSVLQNDLRGCGSATTDPFFGEFGGAVRLTLQSENCAIDIDRNDFRSLGSPKTDAGDPVPAVAFIPDTLNGVCFEGDERNRLSPGRELFLPGAPKR